MHAETKADSGLRRREETKSVRMSLQTGWRVGVDIASGHTEDSLSINTQPVATHSRADHAGNAKRISA